MAKPRTRSQNQPRTGFFILLVLAIISPLIAGLFFADARGVAYGWIVTVIWGAILLASCAFAIIYYAQFVLPSHAGGNWWEGVWMILLAATRFGPQVHRVALKSFAPAFPGEELLPPSFATVQAGMLPSHLVLALNKNGSFSRAAGPGFVRLQTGEQIVQVIDLRRHVRAQELTVNTRDGIPLETSLKVLFQVKESAARSSDGRLPYAYDRNAVFLLSQLSTVDERGHIQPWSEQIAPQAATFAVSEFAQFTLDELSDDPLIFNGIERRVKHQIIAAFEPYGIHIHAVHVAAEAVPEAIIAQRLATWRAPWESRMRLLDAGEDEEAQQQFRLARAHAQIEIIERIIDSIDEMRRTEDASLSDIVTIRVVDALEDASAKSAAQLMLPSRVYRGQIPPAADEENSRTGEGNHEQ